MEHLTKEQLDSLLVVAKAASQRDYLAIKLGYEHGLRISEVCGLTPDHVRDGFMVIQRLKGSLRTAQPLRPDTRKELDEYVKGMGAKQEIFGIKRSMLSKLFAKYAKLVSIPVHLAHFHILKHTLAMYVIQKAGIEDTRQYLGHRSIASTGCYLKTDDATASAAIQRILSGV